MGNKKLRRWPLSLISTLHYVKFFFRSALFLAAALVYIVNRVDATGEISNLFYSPSPFLVVLWLIFAVEMVLRFFPSELESVGCQKQFARNYLPTGNAHIQKRDRTPIVVAGAWLLFNGAIGALYLTGVIDRGIMLLLSLFFSVCDMICILFFCPFQTLIMKNKCCGSCRIYNWDYAMMFTPLIFVKSLYTWGLVALSIGLLLKWEIIYFRHPERFSEQTNSSLSCAKCREKLCRHKKSLRYFLGRQRMLYEDSLKSAQESAMYRWEKT